ncbi:MAG TPA: FAD/NAD(P)-binding protein [Kineosporiaceae bacterium]|nr:FAD/NAD(P)-binding protein [Kineosporiaceae bacterium]
MRGDAGARVARPRILIVGGGAAGTLVALHLIRTAGRRSTGCDIVLLDPVDLLGRGVAFGTTDEQHLLNVPASGMSALPEDPGHFVAWRGRQDPDRPSEPWDFAPRRHFARYLHETLTDALAKAAGQVALRQVRAQAVAVRRAGAGAVVVTDDGREVTGDALVIATGLPVAGHAWAPEGLSSSAFFVPDPWAPGALEVIRRDRCGPGSVLLVGTGLTMVDVALSLAIPPARSPATGGDRVLHAISRSGRLPRSHARAPKLAAIPDVSSWGPTLSELRERVGRHFGDVAAASGDWRPAMDGLRVQVSTLWSRLSEPDRITFLAQDAGRWNVLRHRMPRSSAMTLNQLRSTGQLRLSRGSVADAQPLARGGLRVGLSDGTHHDVGWVVNCTGPQTDIRLLGNPLLDDLLRPGNGAAFARVATGGMGVQTANGRLINSYGNSDAPLWTIGALRRGELWESTAIPEIRSQALVVATAVLDAIAPLSRRLADGRIVSGHHPIARPRDPLGLPLSTTAEAATSFNAGLERVMRLQSGAEELLREATGIDPDFALAHAALAMLGHEAGAPADVAASLAAARRAVAKRGDDRERSLVEVIGRRVTDTRRIGAQALKAHISDHPRDVLAVSAAVPTIAFSGVTDLQQEAWELVEGLAPAYGDHWWYISLLAFTRQEQSRFEEAGLLAESALACEPSSGHAVHAQTHVMYETGQHEEGRVWLDHWITETGRSAGYRAHFAWHAALHELALGDLEAVRRRYQAHLAPPAVTGVRALIDSAALLWRWQMDVGSSERGATPPPVHPVIGAIEPALLRAPQTPFIALYAAIALAASNDRAGLEVLRRHCQSSPDGSMRVTVVAVCEALIAVCEQRWEAAVQLLEDVLPGLVQIAGSAAQREVFQDTLIFALVKAGRSARAGDLLDSRLIRRPSPLDQRRRHTLRGLQSPTP